MVKQLLLSVLLVIPFLLSAQNETDSVNYAFSLLTGRTGRLDYEKGISILKDYATQGNADALNGLGICYLKGIGIAQNEEVAHSCFEEAAQQNCGKAWFNLGHMHYNEKSKYYDLSEAKNCFLRAIDCNCLSALYPAGCFYYFGYEQPVNYSESFKLFEQGSLYKSPECMYMLGLSYMYGHGTAQDLLLAEEWLENARLYGCVEAQSKIEELRGMTAIEDMLNLKIFDCNSNGNVQFCYTLPFETECQVTITSSLQIGFRYTKSLGICPSGENNVTLKTALNSVVYVISLKAGNISSSQTFYVK